MSTYENLLLEVSDGIATITINRPKKLNSLNAAVLRDLADAIHDLFGNKELRAVILTGAGKAFVAGADIFAMSSLTPLEAENFSREGQATFRALEELPVPVIAAVNGYALGGGCELALACDIIYASTKARFGQPEVSLGVVAGFGGTQRLARLVGPNQANELLFTGRIIDHKEAERIGLVNRVFEPEQLLEEARKTAQEIATKAPIAVAISKRLVLEGADLSLERALSMEASAFGSCFATEDGRDGLSAFVEKRKPDFKNK